MLTAVWIAVVAFVAGVGVAVYVMIKAARLMSETSAAVAGLRERGDLLIERANTAIDQAGEQIARTQTVAASIEGATTAMAQMTGHLAATAPALPAQGVAASGPYTWAAALVYGVRWALGVRRPGRGAARPGDQLGRKAAAPDGRDAAPASRKAAALASHTAAALASHTAAALASRGAAARAGRANGTPR
jgi:hypothetical protein